MPISLRGKMAGWQEMGEGRLGNTAELFDETAGHFNRNP
jgi:hypothetical protein